MSASFMQTILIPIQGELPHLLDTSRDDAAWVITVTLLVSAVCTPISGRLGDMYGKRRVALVLLSALTVGSVLAALSSWVVPLIIGRGLQGLGMGVIPIGIAILRDVMPRERLGTAVALVSATLGVGGALGLPLSALVSEHADWHLLFWIAAALGAISLALTAWLVPPSTLRTGGRLDLIGAVGLATGLVALLLADSKGTQWGWSSLPTLGCLGGGVAVLIAWGFYELRRTAPLVDLRVSARPPVLLTNLASVALGFALFASTIAFPQILGMPDSAGGFGLSLLGASLILMPSGLAMLAMSPVAGALERKAGPKPLLVLGAAIIAIGYGLALLVELQAWHILVVNTLIGIGIGLGYAAMPSLIMRSVPSHETAAANGINTLMRSLGTALAAAAVAAILAQSTAGSGGLPEVGSFRAAYLLALVAAVLSTLIAVMIPKPHAPRGEHEALPADD